MQPAPAHSDKALVSELFVALGDHASGTTVYYGIVSGEWFYRCSSSDSSAEIWAISEVHDAGTLARCDGRLWFDLASGRARSDFTDHTKTVGFWLDLRVDNCGPQLTTVESRQSVLVAETATDNSSEEQLVFFAGVSAQQVACTLLWRLGSFRNSSRAATVYLPTDVDVTLVGDVVVRSGELIKLVAPEGQGASLILGQHRVQVESGGRLILERVRFMDSNGSTAVFSEGVVTATNCSFIRCRTGTNIIARFTESFAQKKGGACMMAIGGAVVSTYAGAEFNATDSFFSSNSAQDASDANWAGAIAAVGSLLVLQRSTLQDNVAEGGDFAALAGAIIVLVGATLDMSDCVVVRNAARQPPAAVHGNADESIPSQSLGGAIGLNAAVGRISSTLIADNLASLSGRSAQAGCGTSHRVAC
jgi:hypothetical protein